MKRNNFAETLFLRMFLTKRTCPSSNNHLWRAIFSPAELFYHQSFISIGWKRERKVPSVTQTATDCMDRFLWTRALEKCIANNPTSEKTRNLSKKWQIFTKKVLLCKTIVSSVWKFPLHKSPIANDSNWGYKIKIYWMSLTFKVLW